MDAAGNLGKAGETKALSQGMQPQQYPGANEPSAVQPNSTASGAINPAVAGGDAKLVGVFAGESIAGGGTASYLNTQLNWTFKANGTVLYGAQSHYTTSEQDYEGDQKWSASGQTAENVDRGHWHTSGNLLTIQWDNGKVSRFAYSFEPDGSLVYRHPNTRKLINFYPRIQ
jgi:hypothetical protein